MLSECSYDCPTSTSDSVTSEVDYVRFVELRKDSVWIVRFQEGVWREAEVFLGVVVWVV